MDKSYRIVSLTPNTTNTVAVYRYIDEDDGHYEHGKLYEFPVFAWALVEGVNKWFEEEEGAVSVHGLVSHLDYVELAPIIDNCVFAFKEYK